MEKKNEDIYYIETNVDKLYKRVKKDKIVKITDIADEMKIDKELVEEWAKVLEEHGLIKIFYPIMGDPELKLVDESDKNEGEQ